MLSDAFADVFAPPSLTKEKVKRILIGNELINKTGDECSPNWVRTTTYQLYLKRLTLSATDVLAPTTMKNAAKCDTSCELRNPVSHQNFERILHFLRGVCLLECLFIPTSKLTSVKV